MTSAYSPANSRTNNEVQWLGLASFVNHDCTRNAKVKYNKKITPNVRASVVWYPWYPGDDADVKFNDTVIKSSLKACWQTLNFLESAH